MNKTVMIINKVFSDINPLICGCEQCEKGHSFGPATRDFYLIHYVISGKGSFLRNNNTTILKKGDIFLISPYETTTYNADEKDPWVYIWVGFTTSFDISNIFSHHSLSIPDCEHLFYEMLNCSNFGQAQEFYIAGKIFELIAFLKSKLENNEQNIDDYVLKAQNYIENNYQDEISISKLSDYLNLNRCYFSTLFKQKTGKTPQQYIVDFRLEKAAQYITSTNCKPAQACAFCGYKDVFNFSRMFKRKFGIAPSQYTNATNQVKRS